MKGTVIIGTSSACLPPQSLMLPEIPSSKVRLGTGKSSSISRKCSSAAEGCGAGRAAAREEKSGAMKKAR